MQFRKLGASGIEVAPLVLGGNVFGWTADKAASFAILDRFMAAGFNAIDTADVYSIFVPGHIGGESETVLGEWMKARGNRDKVVLITKGGLPMGEGLQGLGRDYLTRACDASLARLQTDYIDVYFTHRADDTVPIGETLDTLASLKAAGKIRANGCSNYTDEQLAEALAAGETGPESYDSFQPHYNIAWRAEYEDRAEDLCVQHNLGVITYFSLGAGFLTGKYRNKADFEGKARGGSAGMYYNEANMALLDRLDAVAKRHNATMAQVALAWLMARPSVTAPIASATSIAQLDDILKSAEISLSADDMAALEVTSTTN
jgi:aryl-alcohol dehydrogenase-like predicted oxidoreductase